jgi:hypothetical protein
VCQSVRAGVIGIESPEWLFHTFRSVNKGARVPVGAGRGDGHRNRPKWLFHTFRSVNSAHDVPVGVGRGEGTGIAEVAVPHF